jgi:hypothetical protein
VPNRAEEIQLSAAQELAEDTNQPSKGSREWNFYNLQRKSSYGNRLKGSIPDFVFVEERSIGAPSTASFATTRSSVGITWVFNLREPFRSITDQTDVSKE